MIPPHTVSGKHTKAKRQTIIIMVPKGRAAVEFWVRATVFTQEKTAPRGTGKTKVVVTMVRTQLPPPICLNKLEETNPPTKPVRE